VPVASLYLTVDPASMEVKASDSRIERVAIADNLRLAELDTRLNDEAVAAGKVEGPPRPTTCSRCGSSPSSSRRRAARARGKGRPPRLHLSRGRRPRLDRARRRGTPVDMLVAELMIHVNSTWGKLLAERGYDAIYRNQGGAKTRMEVVPGAHQWLGVSHYAWTSSPLRRFTDLANQRQLVALLAGAEPGVLEGGARGRRARLRGGLRGLCRAPAPPRALLVPSSTSPREGVETAEGSIVRDELVRLDRLPLVVRALGLPAAAPGERVSVAFGDIDLWEAHVLARYAGKSSTIPLMARPERQQ
jgi:exoribonuclease-2